MQFTSLLYEFSVFSKKGTLIALLGTVFGSWHQLAAAPDLYLEYHPLGNNHQSELVRPAVLKAGATIQLAHVHVRNKGTAAVPNVRVGVYLSRDDQLDAEDRLLISHQTAYQNAIEPDNERKILWIFQPVILPVDVPIGTYYVLVAVDDNRLVQESDESNNTISQSITIALPDLRFDNRPSVSPAEVAPGGGVTFNNIQIRNASPVSIGDFSLGLYLSRDARIDPNDTLLAEFGKNGLGAGNDTSMRTFTGWLPTDLPSGEYHVGILLDNKQLWAESDENNNTLTSIVRVSRPAERPANLGWAGGDWIRPTTIQAGESIQFDALAIRNTGQGPAAAFVVGYYLSKDQHIDGSDLLLHSVGLESLAVGRQQRLAEQSMLIPGSVASGSYYIGVMLDAENQVAETNESDNTRFHPITINANRHPDLSFSRSPRLLTPFINAGALLPLSEWQIQNQGSVPAQEFQISVILSRQKTYSRKDKVLQTVTVSGLKSGQTRDFKASTLRIPANTRAGDYYIHFVIDADSRIAEGDEKNNAVSWPVKIGPVLIMY
ncbi:MAG: hypothetical protein KDK39_01900 [Leptospiraceae bacterium]|nr:hypothetical protein [Leptospiraceae bacterium]